MGGLTSREASLSLSLVIAYQIREMSDIDITEERPSTGCR